MGYFNDIFTIAVLVGGVLVAAGFIIMMVVDKKKAPTVVSDAGGVGIGGTSGGDTGKSPTVAASPKRSGKRRS